MSMQAWMRALVGAVVCAACVVAYAGDRDCPNDAPAAISFIQYQSPNLAGTTPLTIKGKLSLPIPGNGKGCGHANRKWPAVLILHGSAGPDSRGDFYEAELNAHGIATLQIDMWEARGVTSLANRPAAPILTYPDAFSALAFLSNHPNIAAGRVGVLGFSWGGVISLASAEKLYSGMFGGGRTFAAHVANYPVCWGANNTTVPALQPPAQKGTQFLHLTGAPVLIQIGTEDDYDNGTEYCHDLADLVNPTNNNVVKVVDYQGAYHAWDRLWVPVSAPDPYGNEGSFFTTGQIPLVQIVPNVDLAYESRDRVVRFFQRNL